MGAATGEPSPRHELIETLRQAQRFGFFGSAPVEQGIEHAEDFVVAIGPVPPRTRVLDLGSGGGLPGLVIADRLPDANVTLLDRREKRTDFLRQAAARLGFDHVEVIAADAARHAGDVAARRLAGYDVVTARSFGPPERTLRIACQLLAERGVIVISEPPQGERWDPALLDDLGLESEKLGRVRRFTRD